MGFGGTSTKDCVLRTVSERRAVTGGFPTNRTLAAGFDRVTGTDMRDLVAVDSFIEVAATPWGLPPEALEEAVTEQDSR